MEHTRKLIITLCMVALLLISGCATQTAQTTVISIPDKTSIQEKTPIKIGALLPLSGPNAKYGEEIRQGIELAREELNSQGGINGRNVEVLYEDDQADPKTGVSAIQKLIDVEGVHVILGPWASGVALATAPIAEDKKVIMLAEAIAPAISDAGDYIFRIQASAVYYSMAAAQYLVSVNATNAAVLYIDNDFGRSFKDAFIKDFTATGGRIVADEPYDASVPDFRTQLMKIKDSEPDAVMIIGYQETANAIKQMHEMGIKAQIVAGPPFENPAIIEALGKLAEGVRYTYHYDPRDPNTKDFAERFRARYQMESGGFAPLMYDGFKIVSEALKKCGEDTNCIKSALYDTRHNGVMGEISFDEKGDPHMPIIMKTVRDGKFVRFEVKR
ncbi:MAG: penicillin-binding protein activator [Nanoarchaeota archaeon]